MLKAAIFDWDGVIVDTVEIQYNWFKHCCKHFNKEYPFANVEEMKSNIKEPFPRMFEEFGFDWEEDREDISHLFHQYMKKQNVPIKSGMRDVLADLKGSDYRLGIVSSNREKIIREKLEGHDLGKYFDAVVGHQGRDEHLKPSPKMIEFCLEKIDLGPEDVVYIGDQPTDIEAAKRAE
ncbi:MAG: HAD family hydrolase, partial [Candidatus Aenigmatarchaeota archaeon]